MIIRAALSVGLLLLSSLPPSLAVKRGDFKTCDQSGFCRRNRGLSTRASEHSTEWRSPYFVQTVDSSSGTWKGEVKNALFPEVKYELEIRVLRDGTVRVLLDEKDGLKQRYNETSRWALVEEPLLMLEGGVQFGEKENESKIWFGRHSMVRVQHNPLKVEFFRDGQPHVVLNEGGLFNMEHFRVKSQNAAEEVEEKEEQEEGTGEGVGVKVKGFVNQNEEKEKVVLQKPQKINVPGSVDYPHFLPEDENGMWEESFGGKTDSKPKGPESLSMDITFLGYEHVYGIPEHASPLSLRTTKGGDNAYTDPYRLFNLDVFEYEADSEMALYGAVPFMKAHRPSSTVGVLWLNGAETWVDIEKGETGKAVKDSWKAGKFKHGGPEDRTTKTHWMSESGILDLFVFLGPSNEDIFTSYARLTGTTALPQYFAIGHHQCRWNYLSQEDVLEVSRKFDEFDIPMDVIWLDIEYAEEHKYFVWNKRSFPDPEKMQEGLAERGRKLVAIVDPHIKKTNDLYVYTEAQQHDVLVKDKDGKEFQGWCWTGDSAWVDYFNPKSFDWWASLFKFDKFKGSTKNLFIWNDMNEPSVFNGPEITFPRDVVHHGGWENRDVHNINGMVYHNLTSQALIQREDTPKRPFVLSRSFFAGSQRYGAIWTGDNMGYWSHLAHAPAMILANSIAGINFIGADVGGFFGDPSPELLVRWYQMGAFHPFFRAHAHIDTKRREPYLFDEPIRSHIRDAVRLRYSLLPTWYSAFFEANNLGFPIARPQYVVFPDDKDGFAVDDQYFIGSSGLLVKPVTQEGATETSVYLAGVDPYYNYFTNDIFYGPGRIDFPAPLDTVPLFQRGGSILSRRDTIRRSAPLMWKDPLTLVVAIDRDNSSARGQFYMDDGESYNNEQGQFVWRHFNFGPDTDNKSNLLFHNTDGGGIPGTSRSLQKGVAVYDPDYNNEYAKAMRVVTVDTIEVLGLPSKPKCLKLSGRDQPVHFEYLDGFSSYAGPKKSGVGRRASKLIIKDLKASISEEWRIEFVMYGEACQVPPALPDRQTALQSPLCPPNHFRCANTGHIPACILTSRVDDGLCDPECCDGSDERDGKVSCPNRCQEVGAEHRKKLEEENRKFRVGGKVRGDYIKFGQKEKETLQGTIDALQASLSTLEVKEKKAKAELDRLEAESASESKRKMESKLYKRLQEHQTAIATLRQQKADLETDLAELSSILNDLSRDFNPNYQDMAVLGATRAFTEWKESRAAQSGEEGIEIEGDEDEDSNDATKFSDDDLDAIEKEDLLELIDSLSPSSETPKPAPGEPSGLMATIDGWKTSVFNILELAGVISQDESSSSPDTSERPEVAKARKRHSDAQAELEKAKREIEDKKKEVEKNFGREWEFKKLDGTCLEKDTGEYTYDVCLFQEAHQKSNKGHGSTSLGKFSSWSTGGESPSSDEYYMKQVYSKGARCWNGPERSVKIDLVCGTQNALLSVVEPNKCEYLYKVSTPAVCWPRADAEETRQKEEL
ncbi:glycoside hydrolase family 31 protein [Atractiella rhizophila]|nr:glycoside hydrolase family 31 protein [Atractiella rhizophila]